MRDLTPKIAVTFAKASDISGSFMEHIFKHKTGFSVKSTGEIYAHAI